MVTLSVTRSRIASVLRRAAVDLADWDAHMNPMVAAIDRAADYCPGSPDIAAEDVSVQAWDAVLAHLLISEGVHEEQVAHWETRPYRVAADLNRALLAAAKEVDGR